jgi:signal transduction histidine kinase
MGSILVIFAGVVYCLEVEAQLQDCEQKLIKKGKTIAAEAQYQFQQKQWQFDLENIPALASNTSMCGEIVYARWYNLEGKLVQFVGTPAPKQLTARLGYQTIKSKSNQTNINLSKIWLRQVTLPVVINNSLLGYLQVATSITNIRENLDQTRLSLSFGVPIALSLIGLTGWFLGGLAMKPIHRAYEQLQRFTADASHELRAPLAAILSNAQVGLLSPSEDYAQPRRRLQNIVDTTKSMSALINNLLFLARHEGALAPRKLKNVNIVDLLQLLVSEYQAQAVTQNLSFITAIPEKSINIKAEPDLLQQAIRNILNNAFKYTPVGGNIYLRLFIQSGRVIIQVEDNGIGIPSADLPHIFSRFYRVDTVRSRETGGFGLGLAIALQIVEAHKGQITAYSIPAQGSTFQIQLPLR